MKLKENFPSLLAFREAGAIVAIHGLAIFGPLALADARTPKTDPAFWILIAGVFALVLYQALKALRLGSRKPLIFKVLVPVALLCVPSIVVWTSK